MKQMNLTERAAFSNRALIDQNTELKRALAMANNQIEHWKEQAITYRSLLHQYTPVAKGKLIDTSFPQIHEEKIVKEKTCRPA